MKKIVILALILALLGSMGLAEAYPTPRPMKNSRVAALEAAGQTDQIVLVEYMGGTDAVVSRHERIGGLWTELDTTYGYVGRTGMGKTRAGDNKTPLGTYNLTTPFGILEDPGAILPYLKVTEYHYWCSTSDSEYYNQMVDSRVTGRGPSGPDEVIIEYPGFYNYCLFIDYNAQGVPRKGACLFLHCIGDRDWTHGCIAVPEAYMKRVICWVREGAKIVILENPLPEPDLPEAPEDAPAGCVVGLSEGTNIRQGPGKSYAILGVLMKDQRLDFLNESLADEAGRMWYRVRYRESEGWICADYAALVAESLE